MVDRHGSAWIKDWRESQRGPDGRPLSQKDAGDMVGVSQATWSDWESGTKTPRIQFALALHRLTGAPLESWARANDAARDEVA